MNIKILAGSIALAIVVSLGILNCRLALEASAQEQSQNDELSLELHLEKEMFLEDEPVFYMLKLTNISQAVVRLSPFTMWSDQVSFRFVRQPGGEVVPQRGLQLYTIYGEDMSGDSLAPGESFYHSAQLNYHGERGTYYQWTGTRTVPPGEYRLNVTYLSNLRGAVFGEGDPEPIEVAANIRVVARGPAAEEEFQEVVALFMRLGTFRESSEQKMSAASARQAFVSAEAFVRSHPESPFAPLVYGAFLARAGVRAAYARPAVPADEIKRDVSRIESIAAAQAPASLTRLRLVFCEPKERRPELLERVERARSEGGVREARIAQRILEFVEWAEPLDRRPSVHLWGQMCS